MEIKLIIEKADNTDHTFLMSLDLFISTFDKLNISKEDKIIACSIDGEKLSGSTVKDIEFILNPFITEECREADLTITVDIVEDNLRTVTLIKDNRTNKVLSVFDKEKGKIDFMILNQYIGAKVKLIYSKPPYNEKSYDNFCYITGIGEIDGIETIYFRD